MNFFKMLQQENIERSVIDDSVVDKEYTVPRFRAQQHLMRMVESENVRLQSEVKLYKKLYEEIKSQATTDCLENKVDKLTQICGSILVKLEENRPVEDAK